MRQPSRADQRGGGAFVPRLTFDDEPDRARGDGMDRGERTQALGDHDAPGAHERAPAQRGGVHEHAEILDLRRTVPDDLRAVAIAGRHVNETRAYGARQRRQRLERRGRGAALGQAGAEPHGPRGSATGSRSSLGRRLARAGRRLAELLLQALDRRLDLARGGALARSLPASADRVGRNSARPIAAPPTIDRPDSRTARRSVLWSCRRSRASPRSMAWLMTAASAVASTTSPSENARSTPRCNTSTPAGAAAPQDRHRQQRRVLLLTEAGDVFEVLVSACRSRPTPGACARPRSR